MRFIGSRLRLVAPTRKQTLIGANIRKYAQTAAKTFRLLLCATVIRPAKTQCPTTPHLTSPGVGRGVSPRRTATKASRQAAKPCWSENFNDVTIQQFNQVIMWWASTRLPGRRHQWSCVIAQHSNTCTICYACQETFQKLPT